MIALLDENHELSKRLDRLKNLSKKVNKRKMKHFLTPEKKQKRFENKQKFGNVESKVDFKSQKEYQEQKYWKLQKKKEQKEMINCTFRPKLNETSQRMVETQNYIAPHHKRLKKKQDKKKENPVNSSVVEMNMPVKSKKKTNFYSRQIKWLKKKKKVQEQKRLDKLKEEFQNLNKNKISNKFSKSAIQGKKKDFLNRMENEKKKSKLRKSELINKFQSNSFKPVINRNYQVKSRVMDSLSQSEVFDVDAQWTNNLNQKR